MNDARFEDVSQNDQPIRLRAESAEDLAVISALLQDAIGKAAEIIWARGKRRLVLLVNRFRWEDVAAAETERRPFERVQVALTIENVSRVRARGLEPKDGEVVFSLLAAEFAPEDAEDPENCAGTVILTLAGDGALAADVECLEVTMADVTRPWAAKATSVPSHDRP